VSVWQRQARSPRLGPDAGAAAGLMLALRRQHHQEIATALTDRDATQRPGSPGYTPGQSSSSATTRRRSGSAGFTRSKARSGQPRATPGHSQRGLVLPRRASSLITCVSTGSRVSPRRGLPARNP